ncbi:hypothetical protein [Rhodococcus tukisamuensis]|uniref:hypothetical protein n=1 Tax=Rhodococcus tukisamuensis TaxID=168276 RepID=UPI001FE00325|nr:hypothetical protein [Rhodococcus tukisamuensis]
MAVESAAVEPVKPEPAKPEPTKPDLTKAEPTVAEPKTSAAETAVDETVVDETVADEETPPAAQGRRRPRLAAIVAGVLVAALAVAAVLLLIDRTSANERDARRNAFVQTARQTMLNLTTITPDTAKEDVERILAGASGEFKSEFDGRQDPFVSVVKEASVTTEGSIVESGLESESDDGKSATVLVAARANVTMPDQSQGGPRDFRMRVTVTDDGGTMTASKVEFVP